MRWLLFYVIWIYFTKISECLNYSYVMVFMENSASKKEEGGIHMFIGTSQPTVCTGYINTPLLHGNNNIQTDFTISGPNGSHFVFDASLKLKDTGLQLSTFVVESSQPLTVIGLNREFPSSDSFLAFSTTNLGVEYFAVSFASESGDCFLACQFAMVAIENDTKIVISMPSNPKISPLVTIGANTYTNGQTIKLNLEQYQSYQIQSKYDLTGTQVVGDKPFAMFSGNVKTNLGKSSRDHLAEQLIPVESLGRSFTVVPTPDQRKTTNLLFRVVATKSGTVVKINEDTKHKLDKPGEWVEISEPHDEYFSVTSNYPVMVMDFLSLGIKANNTDPCLMVIVPTEQWQARYFFFALDIYTNYFIVVIENSVKGGLLLNGEPVNNVVWKPVKSSSLVGGYFNVNASTNLLTTQFQNVTFAAYVYGRVGVETHCTVGGVDLDPKKVEQAPERSTIPAMSQQDSSVSTKHTVSSNELKPTSTIWSSSDQKDFTQPTTVMGLISDPSGSSSDWFTVESSLNLQTSFSYTSEIFSSSVEISSTSSSVDATFTTIYASEVMTTSTRAPGSEQSRSTNVPFHPNRLCRCGCSKIKLNSTETDQIISSIQERLFVDKQKVSKNVRKKTSARDNRNSSTSIGTVGVVFILILLGALIVLDIPKIYRDYKVMRHHANR